VLEQLLQKEQADLTAADERRADFKSRLAILEQRPEAISQSLAEATQQREEASAELQAPAADDASPVFAQAQQWAAQTRYMALSTEIKMLDRELSSRPLRTQLLRAKRDKEDANVDWIGERVLALGELIDRKRRQAAEQATTEAEETQRELEGMHPVVVELSAQNAALSRDVSDMTKRLKAQDLVRQHLEQLVEQIGAAGDRCADRGAKGHAAGAGAAAPGTARQGIGGESPLPRQAARARSGRAGVARDRRRV
jgi:potassium efflux system protein